MRIYRLLITLTLLWMCLQLSAQEQECYNRRQLEMYTDDQVEDIMAYVCDGQVEAHMNAPPGSHGDNFLQWHREFIAGLENHLLTTSSSNLVPLPAWDPCTTIPPGSLSTCSTIPAMDTNLEGTELSSCKRFDTDIYDCANLCDFPDFETFQSQLQLDHNGIHGLVDGSFQPMSSTAGVLLFWPFHAYIDDIYMKYQAATADAGLPMTLELVETDCCTVTFRAPDFCCIDTEDWDISDGRGNNINSTWYSEGYNYMNATVYSQPGYTVSVTYTGSCGASKTVATSFLNELPLVPQLPDSPPLHMQSVCFEDMYNENCYDFGRCIESYEVSTSSDKLVVSTNGSEICIYYLHPLPYVGTVTLTPSSCAGTGQSVTWTIYANQQEDCNGFGDGFRITEESPFSVFPNPFTDELNVKYLGWDTDKSYTAQLHTIDGRLIRQTDQQERGFDTSDLPAGVYFLDVRGEKNELLFMDKFVKQ